MNRNRALAGAKSPVAGAEGKLKRYHFILEKVILEIRNPELLKMKNKKLDYPQFYF